MSTPFATKTQDLECFASRMGLLDDFDSFYESYYFLTTDAEDLDEIEEVESLWY